MGWHTFCLRILNKWTGLSWFSEYTRSVMLRVYKVMNIETRFAQRISDEAFCQDLLRQACMIRDAHRGAIVTYSRKVFIPLTNMCCDEEHGHTWRR